MLALIILMIFGLGTAYFATQNTGLVHIMFGNYLVQGIPLYIVVVGSILLGVFISLLISIVNSFSTNFLLHSKENTIKDADKVIQDLRKENEALKIENAKIKERAVIAVPGQRENKDFRPSLFQRARQSFG